MAGLGDWIAQILDLAQGAQGRDLNRGSTAADIADPFRGERGKYWDRLSTMLLGDSKSENQMDLEKLLREPGNFKMDPGAQFAMEQGLEGVARHGNAMFGTTRSGGTAIELEKYATGFAGEQYSNRIQQLLGLTGLDNNRRSSTIDELMGVSGAKTGSPAAAADAYLGGFKNQDRRLGGGLSGNLLDDLFGGLLGGGSDLLGKLFKGLGGGSDFDFSGINLTGGVDDFLASLGLDDSNVGGDWGIDSDVWDRLRGIFTLPGEGGETNLDLGDISDSTRNILEGIFGGGLP